MASVDPPRHVLLGGLEHGFYDFPYRKNNPYIGNVIIPIDELIFVRGVGTPTSVEMQIGLKKQIQHAKHSGITYLLSLQRCQKHCKYVVSQRWWVCKFSTTYTNIVPNGAKRIGEVYVQYSWPLHLTLVVLACQASERAEWAERLVELQTEEKQTADVDAVELGAPMAPEKVFHFEPISIGDIEILKYWDIELHFEILRYIEIFFWVHSFRVVSKLSWLPMLSIPTHHKKGPRWLTLKPKQFVISTNTPLNLPAREVNLLRKLSHGSSVYHEFPPYSAQRITTYAIDLSYVASTTSLSSGMGFYQLF